jgi:hypothetical protein
MGIIQKLLNCLLLLERRIYAHATAGRAYAGAVTGRTLGHIGGKVAVDAGTVAS